MAIKWRDELTIDRGPIDQDHHTLIAIINRFETVQPGQGAAARLADILDSLEHYGATHFAREEKLQRQVAFPLAASHGEQHRHLMHCLGEEGRNWCGRFRIRTSSRFTNTCADF